MPTALFVPSYSTDLADAYRLKGAVGDGSTNDTTAVSAAITIGAAQGTAIYLPGGTYSTTLVAGTTLVGPIIGNGQIKDNAGNKRGKIFNAVTSQPSSLAFVPTGTTTVNLDTAFNGDLSHVPFVIEHRVSGADTLGSAAQTTSGYFQVGEASPILGQLYNESGRSGTGSSGRTGLAFAQMRLTNAAGSGGDIMGLNISGVAQGVTGGATRWDENSSVGQIAGGIIGGADGVYLDAYEVQISDGLPAGGGGTYYDVAAVGQVINMYRHGGKAVTGTASGSGGKVRITCASHGYSTGDVVTVWGVGGTIEANGTWTITVISSSTFDLTGSTYANTYTSGGKVFGALGTWWNGVRLQSKGDQPVDAAFTAWGTSSNGYMVGLDLSNANLTSQGTYQGAAITLSAGQRIYLNTSTSSDATGFYRRPVSTGTEWIEYTTLSGGRIDTVLSGLRVLQVSASQVTVGGNLQVTGALAAALSMGSHQITNLTLGTAGTSTAASMLNSLDQFAAPAANVAWNSQKITGLHRGTAAAEAVTWDQLFGQASSASLDLLFPGVVDLKVWGPTASDTWTKPASGSFVVIIAVGAGGGGGGGVGGANSLFGGSGGGSGAAMVAYLPYAAMPSTATVQVGAGGSGGAGSSTTTGNAGSNGTRNTIFDTGNNTLVAPAGGGGGAGGTSQGAAGAAGASGTATTYTGYTMASVETTGTAGGQSSITTNAGASNSGSGAAGGGITSGGAVAGNGGANATGNLTFAATPSTTTAGAAGAILGGVPSAFLTATKYGGGGGGAKTSGTSGAGGAGYQGGGGGGGGSNKAGGTGGAGANGGDGRLIVVVFA